MAATVSNSVWPKPGAWALDSEEHEAQLQQDDSSSSAAAVGQNLAAAAPLSDFPSLSIAATTKTKKKKAQTLSLGEFATYDPAKAREAKVTNIDMTMLPTGPRERSAEELERNKLGGGFRSYGNSSDSGRWGRDGGNSRGSDEPRKQGSSFTPSRADETDDWGAGKKSIGGFERKERGGGFFDNSQTRRADDSDNWAANKSFIPSEGRRYARERVGFESNGGGADSSDNWGRKKKEEEGRRYDRPRVGFESSGGADSSDNWGKKKEEEGRKHSAFDSLRERRGGGFDTGADNWGKKKEEVVSGGSVRPKLNLQPRKVPIGEEQQNGSVVKPKGSSPFGDARPREEVLKEKGVDWKEEDEKLESKIKEKEAVLVDGPSFGKRGFGTGSGRGSGSDDRWSEKSWRKNDAVDTRPHSAEKAEDGHAVEEAENGNAVEREDINTEI